MSRSIAKHRIRNTDDDLVAEVTVEVLEAPGLVKLRVRDQQGEFINIKRNAARPGVNARDAEEVLPHMIEDLPKIVQDAADGHAEKVEIDPSLQYLMGDDHDAWKQRADHLVEQLDELESAGFPYGAEPSFN